MSAELESVVSFIFKIIKPNDDQDIKILTNSVAYFR